MLFVPAIGWNAANRLTALSLLHTASSTSSTITAPAGILAGDLLVLYHRARNNSGTPTDVIPTGFTGVGTAFFDDERVRVSYKVTVGGESGATITSMNGTGANRATLLHYRGNAIIKSVDISSPTSYGPNTGDPPQETIGAASAIGPNLGLAFYSASVGDSALTGSTQSITPNNVVNLHSDDQIIKDYFQTVNPVNWTFDMTDRGHDNCLFGFYFHNFKMGALYPPAFNFKAFSTASSSTGSITCPAGVQAGDLLIFLQVSGGPSPPAVNYGTGFTGIGTVTDSVNDRACASYKIAAGGEGAITGMTSSSDTRIGKFMLQYRYSRGPLSAITASSLIASGMSTADPALQTMTASGGTPPVLGIACYFAETGGGDINSRSTSITPDHDQACTGTSSGWRFYFQDYSQPTSPQNYTWDMGDEGAVNFLFGFYVHSPVG